MLSVIDPARVYLACGATDMRKSIDGLNPCAYLQHLFEQLPGIPRDNTDAIDSLLPWIEPVQSALRLQPTLPLTAPHPS